VRLRASTILKAAFLAAALTIVLGLTMATTAVPEGQILIRGAATGSTLRISVEGERIVVEGHLAPQQQVGCSTERGNRAVCPTDGISSMVIQMGPGDDFVEVLERLPFPLTLHLGGGSDKAVTKGERDTCYPGAARRNRCVLGAGNDICITGNRNSDCVGGPGRDYCKHGSGSDGCWGGPGADICVMGRGQDGCHGNEGNDRLYGGKAADQLYGGPGRDYCDGGRGIGKSHRCEAGAGH